VIRPACARLRATLLWPQAEWGGTRRGVALDWCSFGDDASRQLRRRLAFDHALECGLDGACINGMVGLTCGEARLFRSYAGAHVTMVSPASGE